MIIAQYLSSEAIANWKKFNLLHKTISIPFNGHGHHYAKETEPDLQGCSHYLAKKFFNLLDFLKEKI